MIGWNKPLNHNNQGKRTFYYSGAKIWNKLSPNVQSNYDSMNMHMFNPNLLDTVNFVPFGPMRYSIFDSNLMSVTCT